MVSKLTQYINEPKLTPQKTKTETEQKTDVEKLNALLSDKLSWWITNGFKELDRVTIGKELIVSGDSEEYKWIFVEKNNFKKVLIYRVVPFRMKDEKGNSIQKFGMGLRSTYYDKVSKTEYDVLNMMTNPASPLKANIKGE